LHLSAGQGGGSFLLSIDAGGLCCLWDEGSGACEACEQMAAFPPDAHPSVLLMVGCPLPGSWRFVAQQGQNI
jgi:hypothetical protein